MNARAMGARAVVVHVALTLLSLACGAEGQADLSDFNPPDLGRRVAGLQLALWKYYSRLYSIPNLDSKPPDLVTWMTQVNKPGTFGIWPEVQLMGSDVAPAFPFYDGRTYQDRWAARITGNLFIEKTNTYTLELENREGAKLWVDGSLAVDNDFSVHETGETDMRSKHAHVHLSAGYHHVRIEFFVDQTWTGLRFWYGAPGVPRMIIPASAFSLPDASCCLCQCKRGQCRIADYGTKIVDCLWPTDAGPIDFLRPLAMESTPDPNDAGTCKEPCEDPGSASAVDTRQASPHFYYGQ